MPAPCVTWDQFGFDAKTMAVIKAQEFDMPTPIQCQAVPVALSGRDVVGQCYLMHGYGINYKS